MCAAATQGHSRGSRTFGDVSTLPPSPFSTKRLIVDVIRFQPGETLTEILETPATAEQVKLRGFTYDDKAHGCSRDECVPGLRRGGAGGWQRGAGLEGGGGVGLLRKSLAPKLARRCSEGRRLVACMCGLVCGFVF